MNVFRPPFAASNSVGYDSFAYCRSCRDFVPLMALILTHLSFSWPVTMPWLPPITRAIQTYPSEDKEEEGCRTTIMPQKQLMLRRQDSASQGWVSHKMKKGLRPKPGPFKMLAAFS
jgi:hypothetical protein